VHTRFLEAELPRLLEEAETYRASAPSLATDSAATEAAAASAQADDAALPDGWMAVRAPMPARLVLLGAREGDRVAAGTQVAVLEAMTMEHVLQAPVAVEPANARRRRQTCRSSTSSIRRDAGNARSR
jgi:biotin carboxyl carrier protein